MPYQRVMRPSQNNIEIYGDLQPIAGNIKSTLWVPGENLSEVGVDILTTPGFDRPLFSPNVIFL